MDKLKKEITITAQGTIADIQTEFKRFYPFLSVVFFTSGTGIITEKNKVQSNSVISKITQLNSTVKLNVADERTVAEVEKDCVELLGLLAQVQRKSGNVWNAISITNGWTLQCQNLAAECISTEMQST